jgi:GntR family transcriptional regulator/MocR family aminotransferase
MREHLPDWGVQATNGGSALWVKGPAWLDARQLSELAVKHGVLIEPGDVFFLPDPERRQEHARHFRMGFTAIAEADIEPGVLALREAARELRARFRR